jgi:tRNA(Arg) A34 adenosine deaminase TadA
MKKQLLRDCLQRARIKNEKHPRWGHMHHFTFVIQRAKILEYGVNRVGPAPVGRGYPREFSNIHSEVSAWRKASGLINPSYPIDIVNIRLNKQHVIRMSKPCDCCFGFLQALNCRAVYYTTDNGFSKIRF